MGVWEVGLKGSQSQSKDLGKAEQSEGLSRLWEVGGVRGVKEMRRRSGQIIWEIGAAQGRKGRASPRAFGKAEASQDSRDGGATLRT